MNKQVKELVERVRLTPEEIKFYSKCYEDETREHWHYAPERIAQAQLNKVLNDKSLALIKPYGAFRISREEAGQIYSAIREIHETDFYYYVEQLAEVFAKHNFLLVIPLAEALREAKG